MNVQIAGSGMEIDARIKEIIDTKLVSELKKYLADFHEDTLSGNVMIHKQSRFGFKISFEVKLPGKGGDIYSEEAGDDFINVVIALRKEIERQIKDYKERLQEHRK